jgi:hypothetical protein
MNRQELIQELRTLTDEELRTLQIKVYKPIREIRGKKSHRFDRVKLQLITGGQPNRPTQETPQ